MSRIYPVEPWMLYEHCFPWSPMSMGSRCYSFGLGFVRVTLSLGAEHFSEGALVWGVIIRWSPATEREEGEQLYRKHWRWYWRVQTHMARKNTRITGGKR